jgi:hypothetical protein
MGATNQQRDNPDSTPSLTTPARASEQPYRREERLGFRAVGVAVSNLAGPILAKRGGGILVRLKSHWSAIVGPDWAGLAWPRALGRDGVLKLNAASVAALELQHSAPLLIERINLFFGRSVIGRLVIVQVGPEPLPSVSRHGRPILRPLAANEADALDKRLSGIADPELRTALAKLGRAVIGSGRDAESRDPTGAIASRQPSD